MKRILFIGVFILGLGLSTSKAQPFPPDDPDDIPVDGGLSLLLAGGVGYGVYQYKKRKTPKQDS